MSTTTRNKPASMSETVRANYEKRIGILNAYEQRVDAGLEPYIPDTCTAKNIVISFGVTYADVVKEQERHRAL